MGSLTFDPNPPSNEVKDQAAPEADDKQAELIQWHYCLEHLSFDRLLLLAKLGEIPKCLLKVKPPTCTGCLFGVMTKKPWRAKLSQSKGRPIFKATKPGKCVYIDQMISAQVGFIAQLNGKLTKKRYKAATIFIDHFSRLQHVCLMTGITWEKMVMVILD